MRTNEEFFDHVMKRVSELETQKKKRRAVIWKTAAPVCGIAVVAGGAAAVLRSGRANTAPQFASDVDVVSGEVVPDWIDDRSSADSVVESAPQYVQNVLNINEVEIWEEDDCNLYNIPGQYEMTRDEVLEHFGLGVDFGLSDIVEGLYETAPRNTLLNSEGKHGFCRFYTVDENGNGHWEELLPYFENDEFVFESADGSKTAVVIFDGGEQVIWLRSGMIMHEKGDQYSTEPFYALPTSTVAGVEMRIAHRNIGGYYAEFNTGTLSVGLITEGLSEDETVSILEYLAEYTGAADDTPCDVRVGVVEISYPDIIN